MAVDSDRITPILIAPKRKQNCYDHRLRDAVFHLGQAKTARYLDIPRSTIHGWKKARTKPVVTLVAPNSYVDDSLKERTNKSYSARSIMQADASSCPKSTPGKITSKELSDMRLMLESEDYRHLSIGSIVRLASRLGKVHACSSTWYRAIQSGDWIRSRNRIYPPKPRVGLRAAKPNEYWHVDTTIVRLVDGSRVYLQAVLDNYSRRILAWRLSKRFDAAVTAEILQEAATGLPENTVPSAVMDSGVENVNTKVNELVSDGTIKRVLAQVDIAQSNSMIEAWWRQLKVSVQRPDQVSLEFRLAGVDGVC